MINRRTQAARGTPFDNSANGFIATDTQAAIEEAYALALANSITNYYVNAQTLFQTTSTTYVVLTGMAVTPAAGLYAIWSNFSGNTSTANKVITMAIFKAAVIVSDSERETLAASGSQNVQQATQTVVQFNGSETCGLRVKVSGGTLSITNRSLILIKVG